MSVFHCDMPPLCPPELGGGHNANVGGTLKKIFRRFAPEFVPPNFKTVPAPMCMYAHYLLKVIRVKIVTKRTVILRYC